LFFLKKTESELNISQAENQEDGGAADHKALSVESI